MGVQRSLGPFVAEDSFLRHVDRKGRIRNGIVSPDVFRPREHENTLSFTHQDESLSDDASLERYQREKELRFGDLPGLCKLTFYDLTVSLEPPLPPRRDPNPEDETYGHLHCCTDPPRDDIQCEKMAKLAQGHGVVRDFVPKRKRKASPS